MRNVPQQLVLEGARRHLPAGAGASIPHPRHIASPVAALKPQRHRQWILTAALLALLAWASGAATASQHREPGDFAYYVLALSWSPTFCASRGNRDPLQCNSRHRYDFVVHGLWPQYRKGWPQFCEAGVARLRETLPEAIVDSMLDIMPSRDLVRHQWYKHGTCTGLTPGEYFALTRRLHDAIRIPARYVEPASSIEVSVGRIVADFVATNRGLTPAMISLDCGNRRDTARLAELRICFSRDGAPVACGDNERRRCRAARLVLPPAR